MARKLLNSKAIARQSVEFCTTRHGGCQGAAKSLLPLHAWSRPAAPGLLPQGRRAPSGTW